MTCSRPLGQPELLIAPEDEADAIRKVLSEQIYQEMQKSERFYIKILVVLCFYYETFYTSHDLVHAQQDPLMPTTLRHLPLM